MAKKQETSADQTVEMTDTEAEPVLFPEADNTPEQRAIIRAAKKYQTAKNRHSLAVKECKPEMDDAEKKLIGLMQSAGISAFKFKSMKVTLESPAVKVKIKGIDESDAGDDDD